MMYSGFTTVPNYLHKYANFWLFCQEENVYYSKSSCLKLNLSFEENIVHDISQVSDDFHKYICNI